MKVKTLASSTLLCIAYCILASTPLIGSTSSCDLDWSEAIGLRVDVNDSADCPGGSDSTIQNITEIAELKGGSACGEYILAVTVSGSVEDQNSGYDYVYVNGTLFFSGRNNLAGCNMFSTTETRQITVKASDPITLNYDTVDELYHVGGYAEITNIVLISGPGCEDNDCSSCGAAGDGSVVNSSVDVRIALGDKEGDFYPGTFRIKSKLPDAALYTPEAIEYGIDLNAPFEEIRDTNGAIRQLLTNEVLADVVTLSPHKYEIRFYYAADAGTKSGDYYQPSGSPYKIWKIEDPDEGTGNNYRLHVTETIDAKEILHEYTYVPAHANWTLVSAGLKEVGRKEATVNGDRVETYWVATPGGADTYRRDQVYHEFPWGEERIAETLDPLHPSGGRTTTWSYYTDELADGDNYSQIRLMESANGYWERYEYDDLGRRIKVVSPFGDAGPAAPEADCRVRETFYLSTAPQETRIETVLGQEVSRRYTVFQGNSTFSVIASQPGAAWDAPGNLTTETIKVGGSGPFSDRTALIRHSNGTLTHHTYSLDETSGIQTTVTTRGAPNATATAVVDGTRTTVEEDRHGRLLTEMVEDIAANRTLSFKVVTESDDLGRPLRIDYLDNTFETFAYSCCGLSTHVDREGIETSYFYDDLKRQTSRLRNGISYEQAYDASGRTTEEARVGTDSSRMVQRGSAYRADGRILWQQDALGWKQDYSDSGTASGGEQRTITYEADGATSIRTYQRDGRLQAIEGTVEAPLLYEYGVAAGGFTWTKEIHVGTGGSETEWGKTWRNMLGQTIRTEYPDAAEATRSYNAAGQLVAETDPDGVQTLYDYNARGERTVRAIDLNRDEVIDYAENDRIERTTTEVVDVAGQVRRRTTHEHWETNGSDSPTVASVVEVSADGHQRWETREGQTTYTETSIDGAGERITETTRPDGSSVWQRSVNGQLVERKHYDSAAQILSSTSYLYDAHARLASETRTDVGTTHYTYTGDDQIASITSPDPDPGNSGAGLDPQLTSYHYDDRGRRERVTHPDGAETHTSYYPSGLVKRIWGARTYSVEYLYDPQGRRIQMTTWKDFDGESGVATTAWDYDSQRGWLSQKRYPDPATGSPVSSGATTYTYTDAGRLETRTWARGIVTTYDYGDGGRLAGVTYSDGTPSVTHVLDRLGRIATTTDAAGLLTRGYQAGHVTSEAYSGTGLLSGKSFTRGLDALHRVDELNATGINAITLGYDDASRLATVTQSSHTATYGYNAPLGVVESISIEVGALGHYRRATGHDNLTRIVQADTYGAADQLLARREYQYNAANRRVAVIEEDGRQWSYDYDSLGQVIQAEKRLTESEEVLPGYAFAYSFDDIGNRIQTVVNERIASYSSDALNRYIQRDHPGAVDVRGSAPEQVGVIVNSDRTERTGEAFYAPAFGDNSTASVELDIVVKALDPGPPAQLAQESRTALLPHDPESFSHDLDGNLTQDGLWIYEWDGENRLIAMESRTDLPASVTRQRLEFAYDGQSRRIGKSVYEWDSSSQSFLITDSTLFLYDGWNLIAEYDALNSDALIRSRAWGLDLSGTPQGAAGVGGLLWSSQSGADYAPGFDGNGNIIAWIDLSDGSLAGTIEYGAFGEVLTTSGVAGALPFGFSTKYEDAETRLLYYGYRFYSPGTGRWLNRDPIEEMGGLNLYGFVGNDGVNAWDYLGFYDYEEFTTLEAANQNALDGIKTGHYNGLPQGGKDATASESKWLQYVEDSKSEVAAGIKELHGKSLTPEQIQREANRQLAQKIGVEWATLVVRVEESNMSDIWVVNFVSGTVDEFFMDLSYLTTAYPESDHCIYYEKLIHVHPNGNKAATDYDKSEARRLTGTSQGKNMVFEIYLPWGDVFAYNGN